MSHTFKVGDIVRGISDEYPITNKNMTRGEVVYANGTCIRVKILEHSTKQSRVGESFPVTAKYFRLIEPARDSAHIDIAKIGTTKIAPPSISRVLYNQPATVVFWSDGSKTVAKCAPHEQYDCEKGLAIACAKKLLGAGYAEAFKEFREPVNRVLSRDEVKALPEGCKVFCEIAPWGYFGDGVHKKEGSRLYSADGKHWTIDGGSLKWMRVWLLPRKPTDAELAANPWKREEN